MFPWQQATGNGNHAIIVFSVSNSNAQSFKCDTVLAGDAIPTCTAQRTGNVLSSDIHQIGKTRVADLHRNVSRSGLLGLFGSQYLSFLASHFKAVDAPGMSAHKPSTQVAALLPFQGALAAYQRELSPS
eukprot:CAMPEP_0172776856 /NCGR_PEP_ID=MMETSP1074-20121228/200719_1 /TAXON_ID=2916 /ORGANISM="Ceratium fusus, Strain PA161109" /LENGTH=128 /DNA_ID=CAMNT_0013613705 /DNA_START=296 /DNA_END=680 /DNA_ORIENTATION=-